MGNRTYQCAHLQWRNNLDLREILNDAGFSNPDLGAMILMGVQVRVL